MRTNYYTRILCSVLFFLALLCFFPLRADAAQWRVLKILDGDSIVVSGIRSSGAPSRREEVRLIGIDAPEIGQQPWGQRARRHLRVLIQKTDATVKLEFDIELRDRYGRLLAYGWTKNNVLLNERMVANGYALARTVPPNVKYANRLATAQKKARDRRAGLWKSHAFATSPKEWRREHPR
ncbi:MAG TPA: thermonuclease family protein [Dissulfurispiraceae bacterium]|nr:thermonuclease family protein [Dissulfurispiraceae bacterium]